MSHIRVLVVGESPADELAPFKDEVEVAPYVRECVCRRRFVDPGHVFGEDARPGCPWCRGAGVHEHTLNPLGQWDSFIVTWGELQLAPGACRLPGRVSDLHVGGYSPVQLGALSTNPDRMRRADCVALEELLPYAVVAAGTWHQRDDRNGRWFPSVSRWRELVFEADWPVAYAGLVDAIAGDDIISLVDCHC